jgi:hypothetical protein
MELGDGSFRQISRSFQLTEVTVIALCGGTYRGEGVVEV